MQLIAKGIDMVAPIISMGWKDITSYSQGETDRGPRVMVLVGHDVRVTVHRHRHYDPDVWLLSCHPFFDCKVLNNKELEEAKAEAIELVRSRLLLMLNSLGGTK